MQDHEDEEQSLEDQLEEAVLSSLEKEDHDSQFRKARIPDHVYIFPLHRRPFFPGMAAPMMIEPGPFYEVLKAVAKTEHKFVGLLLTKDENANIYDLEINDFYKVGVLARVLRIIVGCRLAAKGNLAVDSV